jgi:hypothetical protein
MYYDSIETIANSSVVPVAKRLATQLDFDVIIMKLLLAILSFSTINHTVYSNTSSINLSNIKQIIQIQDTYIELAWRYLLYKYNYEWAVKSFSLFIGVIFTIQEAISETQEVQWLTETFDSLVQQTEQTLTLND